MKVELAHDIVALKIWELLPERDKRWRLIAKSLNQRIIDYKQGNGSWLQKDELLGWEKDLDSANLSAEQEWFIDKSKSALNRRGWIEKIAKYSLFALTIFSAWAAIKANAATMDANKSKLSLVVINAKLIRSQKNNTELNIKDNLAQSNEYFGNNEFGAALAFAESAGNVLDNFEFSMDEISGDSTEEAMASFIRNHRKGICAMIDTATMAVLKEPKYQVYLQQGILEEEAQDYIAALESYRLAAHTINTKLIKEKISNVRERGHTFYLERARGHSLSGTTADLILADKVYDWSLKMKHIRTVELERNNLKD